MSSAALPKLDRVTNFRELGGLHTRDGRRVRQSRLFRSGHWGGASDEDIAAMTSLGITTVFDFRTTRDIEAEGADRLPPGTELVSLPMDDPLGQVDARSLVLSGDLERLREHFGEGRAENYMRESAAKLAAHRTEQYGRFLSGLARPQAGPALFHCSAGKDRAGWAASVVLLALGVEEETAADHYLVSNRTYDVALHHGELAEVENEIGQLLAPLIGVRAEYFQASVGAARDRFGSLEGYFSDGLGVSDEELDQLRENWLEPT